MSRAQVFLPNGEPVLRIPLQTGDVALCTQANNEPSPSSHDQNYGLHHALDWVNPARDPEIVVAAASGVVTVAFADAVRTDPSSGDYAGNHVRIEHGNGFSTTYFHLDSVRVRENTPILAGEPIGVMGTTGGTAERHVHFALHKNGSAKSEPIHAIAVAIPNGDSFKTALISGAEFRSSHGKIAIEQNLYGAVDVPDDLHNTSLPIEVSAAFNAGLIELRGCVERFRFVDRVIAKLFATHVEPTVDACEPILRTLVESDRESFRVCYDYHVLGGLKYLISREAFDKTNIAKHRRKDWIVAMLPLMGILFGEIALERGRKDDARASLEMAKVFLPAQHALHHRIDTLSGGY